MLQIPDWMPLPPPALQLRWLAEQRRRLHYYLELGDRDLTSPAARAQAVRTERSFQIREAEVIALLGFCDALPCDVATAQTWPRLDPPHWGPDLLG